VFGDQRIGDLRGLAYLFAYLRLFRRFERLDDRRLRCPGMLMPKTDALATRVSLQGDADGLAACAYVV
jgi:hypothetical protein